MSTVQRFEDLESWQRGRELVRLIYQMTSKGAFARDFALLDQIRRAGISIPSNIAEGFERSGNKEFRQFLYHAKGSIGELQTQLHIADDAGYLTQQQFDEAMALAKETGKLVGGLIRYLDQSEYKGSKYR